MMCFNYFSMYEALCVFAHDRKNRLKPFTFDFSQKQTVYILINAR